MTPLLRAIDKVDAAALGWLTLALQDGLTELQAADPNDVWNVTARFWPSTGHFGASNLEAQPSLGHDNLSSETIRLPHAAAILDAVAIGHGTVVVLISLVPYLRSGHPLSAHALASTLLEEAQRLVDLGLRVGESTHELLNIWQESRAT